jgi:hypothetical protein
MKKSNILTKAVFGTAGLPAVLLALVLTACPTGSDNGSDEPVSVDLSLPPIQEVAAFSGTFVSSETEAKDLVKTAFEEIANISDTSSLQSSSVSSVSQSISRSVYSEPYEQIFDHDTTVLPGAEVTGFVEGRQTISAADDNNPGGTVGDYMEMSLRAKLAIDFNDVTQNHATIKGRYSDDENMYSKMVRTATNISITISFDASAGYAISISKGGKGLKFVMQTQGKINRKTIQGDESTLDDTSGLFDIYKLSLDIYDNDNVKQYSKTFTSYADVADYLGL